ncbi:MAG: hypothetical protein KIS78_20970 [Labilithrix sp.]|nr:hypothetical protein [Labilithrix sp.]
MLRRGLRWQRGAAVVTIVALGRLAVATVVVPAAVTGCTCGQHGSAVELDRASVERRPIIAVEGGACDATSVSCARHDTTGRCEVYWITPTREGRCTISARFSDDTQMEDEIEYHADSEYPCRGYIRPRHDHVTRFYSKT